MRSKFREKEMSSDGGSDAGLGRAPGGSSRRKVRPPKDLILDYKDPETLRPFLSEGGRIVPARVSRLSAKQQRCLAREVKRAQQIALLPASDSHRGLHG